MQSVNKMMNGLDDFQKRVLKMFVEREPNANLTDEEKAAALSIYMHSRSCYLYLRHIFPKLPSESVLKKFKSRTKILPGVDPSMKAQLLAACEKLPDNEKIAILSWDEMKTKVHLEYDEGTDSICGLEAWGNDRGEQVADHALVFMLRGLSSG